MQLFDFYFRQLLTSEELQEAFEAAEDSDKAIAGAIGLYGLAQGGAVTEKSGTPNISVDVSAPLVAYDEDGNRIAVAALTNVDLTVDENSASTTVSTGGHERYLSLFIKFTRSLSDSRLDGNGDAVFYNRAESYEFVVAMGGSAPIGTASLPALRSGHILLADIHLINGQTEVLNTDIDTSRTQFVVTLTGTPNTVQARTLTEAAQALQDQINDILSGVITIAASSVDYDGGAAWADGTTNPATDVEAQLDKIISELADQAGGSTSGAHRVGYQTPTTPWANGNGSVGSEAASSVGEALNAIFADLADKTGAAADGAHRIGFTPAGGIAGDSVGLALIELDGDKANLTGTNTFTGAQTAPNWLMSTASTETRMMGKYSFGRPFDPGTGEGWEWDAQNEYWASAGASSFGALMVPIGNDVIIPGTTLDEFNVRWKPGASRTGVNRMSFQLRHHDLSGTGTEVIALTYGGESTTTEHTTSVTGIGHTVLSNRAYYAIISAGDDGHINPDRWLGLSVQCLWPKAGAQT